MRDVNAGYILRYTHANVASFFFIFVYAQILKIYFNNKLNLLKLYKKFNNRFTSTFLYFLKNKILDQFLTIFKPVQNSLSKINNEKKRLSFDTEFIQWFVGFTDAEGSFWINIKNNSEVHFVFQITLHIEDSAVLYYIRDKLDIGLVTIQGKTCSYRVHAFQTIVETLVPIFDKYPLLTSKYFYYLKFKEAYRILEDPSLTKIQRNALMFELVSTKASEGYVSPAWGKVNNIVSNTKEASLVMSKAWLIGFTEAEGSFYLVNKTKDRIVHGFEITQKLDLIVLKAIGCILGIKTRSKNTHFTVVTTNSRAIENIIKYYNNTMKGMKAFEFKVWARCYVKHKGDFTKLNEIRNKIRIKKLGTTILKK